MKYLVSVLIGITFVPVIAWGGTLTSRRVAAKNATAHFSNWPADWQSGRIGSPEVPYSLGVDIHFTKPKAGEMKMLAAAGFRWIRMGFFWSLTEKHRGHYNFAPYGTLLASVRPYHIRIMFILCFGNPLYEHGKPPSTPKARKAFCRWVAAAMKHFKGRGIMWEMWNEPNAGGFGPPPHANRHYAQLAVQVGKTIRRVAPHELYVGPAICGIEGTYASLQGPTDQSFLKTCFQEGVLKYFNAVTIHPYRPHMVPETVAGDYRQIGQLIRRYAPAEKTIPILSGEWGYTSTWYPHDQDAQARYAARELLVNLSQRIPLSIWYDWHDDGANPKNVLFNYGLVHYAYHAHHDPVYKPKPAYLAIRTLSTQLNGCRFVRRLKVGGKNDYVLLFRGSQGNRIAAWKIGAKPKTVSLPMNPGHYRITDELGTRTRTVDVPRRAKKLKLTLSHDPEYLVPESGH